MIMIGADPHQRTHAACAVDAATGELAGQLTVPATPEGHEELLVWAARRAGERRFGIEDCRHVSRYLERLLLARGEEVVRVAPHLAAAFRRAGRRRGKSDGVDALAVARAALAEPDLPRARLGADERELRLLVDHREDLVGERRRVQQRLRGHLHELGHFEPIPSRALGGAGWLARLGRRFSARGGEASRAGETGLDALRGLTVRASGVETPPQPSAPTKPPPRPLHHARAVRRRPSRAVGRVPGAAPSRTSDIEKISAPSAHGAKGLHLRLWRTARPTGGCTAPGSRGLMRR